MERVARAPGQEALQQLYEHWAMTRSDEESRLVEEELLEESERLRMVCEDTNSCKRCNVECSLFPTSPQQG